MSRTSTSPVGRVAERVVEQVHQHLVEPRAIADHRRGLIAHSRTRLSVAARATRSTTSRTSSSSAIGSCRSSSAVRFDLRQIEKIAHDPIDPIGAAVDRLQHLTARRRQLARRLEERLRVALHHRHRGLELVGGDPDELVLEPIELGQRAHVGGDQHRADDASLGVAQRGGARLQVTGPFGAQVAEQDRSARDRLSRSARTIGRSSSESVRPSAPRTSRASSTSRSEPLGLGQAAPLEEVADRLVHRSNPAVGVADHHPFDHVVEDALHLGGAPLHHHCELGELLPGAHLAGGVDHHPEDAVGQFGTARPHAAEAEVGQLARPARAAPDRERRVDRHQRIAGREHLVEERDELRHLRLDLGERLAERVDAGRERLQRRIDEVEDVVGPAQNPNPDRRDPQDRLEHLEVHPRAVEEPLTFGRRTGGGALLERADQTEETALLVGERPDAEPDRGRARPAGDRPLEIHRRAAAERPVDRRLARHPPLHVAVEEPLRRAIGERNPPLRIYNDHPARQRRERRFEVFQAAPRRHAHRHASWNDCRRQTAVPAASLSEGLARAGGEDRVI